MGKGTKVEKERKKKQEREKGKKKEYNRCCRNKAKRRAGIVYSTNKKNMKQASHHAAVSIDEKQYKTKSIDQETWQNRDLHDEEEHIRYLE